MSIDLKLILKCLILVQSLNKFMCKHQFSKLCFNRKACDNMFETFYLKGISAYYKYIEYCKL